MTNKEELKSKIISANDAYRFGEAVMSDLEYDSLVEEFQAQFPDEYDAFRDSLNEGAAVHGTKVKHPFIMGSLNKVTIETPTDIQKFVKKYVNGTLNVSAKVDGVSCRLHYSHGKLTQASTRGNGEEGIDITDKMKYVNFVPKTIALADEIDIRGELVIFKDDFAKLDGFANPRNATAGIINRKESNKEDLSSVSFIAYTILGDKFGKAEQFSLLNASKFTTAWNEDIDCSIYADLDACVEYLTKELQHEHKYETDGLVIADSSFVNESKYRPDASVAVKGNMNSAVTTVVDVIWAGPSKHGRFCPVAQLEPIQLCGTTVSQATLNNIDFIANKGIKYGSEVRIQKRGEIIPAIVEVLSNAKAADIEMPTECPCCGTKLIVDGVDLRCPNKDCKEQILEQLVTFIAKLNVKGAARKTLENLDIYTFNDLLAFKPNKSKKTEMKLYTELQDKVFTKSKQELLAVMNFRDLGETLINKIVDFYGFESIIAEKYTGLPDGVGETTLQKFKDDVVENMNVVNMIIQDSRYCYSEDAQCVSGASQKAKNGMSVCFTGKLETISRSAAEKMAIEAGFEVKAVNRKLTYLVTNDPNTNSGKGKTARDLGIKIISENEFLRMISDNTLEQDIIDL